MRITNGPQMRVLIAAPWLVEGNVDLLLQVCISECGLVRIRIRRARVST